MWRKTMGFHTSKGVCLVLLDTAALDTSSQIGLLPTYSQVQFLCLEVIKT